MLYGVVLALHSILRWVVVIVALLALVRALGGLSGRQVWSALDRRLGLAFTGALDTQLLIGLLLYVVSPITAVAAQNMGAAMSQASIRFFVAEHWVLMLAALMLAHIGAVRVKKAANDAGRFRQAALFVGLAFVLILAAVPWPFFSGYGRPWLRL